MANAYHCKPANEKKNHFNKPLLRRLACNLAKKWPQKAAAVKMCAVQIMLRKFRGENVMQMLFKKNSIKEAGGGGEFCKHCAANCSAIAPPHPLIQATIIN